MNLLTSPARSLRKSPGEHAQTVTCTHALAVTDWKLSMIVGDHLNLQMVDRSVRDDLDSSRVARK